MSFVNKEVERGHVFKGRWVRGESVVSVSYSGVCVFWSSFRGGGKGSDEEHITYSGGKKIFDLLQCG